MGGALNILEVWEFSQVWNQFIYIVKGENMSDLADILSIHLIFETLDYLKTYMKY